MREKGLEPSRLYRHKILSLACLPIPAFPQAIRFSNQGDNQIWTGDQGVADPRLTAWLCRHCPFFWTTPWTGLEPVTLRLTAACSTYWAIRAKCLSNITNSYWICKYFFLNSNSLRSFSSRRKCAFKTAYQVPSYINFPIFWLNPRPISDSRLSTLLYLHLSPIYLVVFKGS